LDSRFCAAAFLPATHAWISGFGWMPWVCVLPLACLRSQRITHHLQVPPLPGAACLPSFHRLPPACLPATSGACLRGFWVCRTVHRFTTCLPFLHLGVLQGLLGPGPAVTVPFTCTICLRVPPPACRHYKSTTSGCLHSCLAPACLPQVHLQILGDYRCLGTLYLGSGWISAQAACRLGLGAICRFAACLPLPACAWSSAVFWFYAGCTTCTKPPATPTCHCILHLIFCWVGAVSFLHSTTRFLTCTCTVLDLPPASLGLYLTCLLFVWVFLGSACLGIYCHLPPQLLVPPRSAPFCRSAPRMVFSSPFLPPFACYPAAATVSHRFACSAPSCRLPLPAPRLRRCDSPLRSHHPTVLRSLGAPFLPFCHHLRSFCHGLHLQAFPAFCRCRSACTCRSLGVRSLTS